MGAIYEITGKEIYKTVRIIIPYLACKFIANYICIAKTAVRMLSQFSRFISITTTVSNNYPLN